jgi:hypothetical protein
MTRLAKVLDESAEEGLWGRLITSALIIGLMSVAILGYVRGGQAFGSLVGLFLAASAVSVGGLLGFLFGIPRALQEPRETVIGQSTIGTSYVANTNLEEISKWLTSTIVGLTLIQAEPLLNSFERMCLTLTSAFGEHSAITAPLIAIILVYFSVTGGVGTYLWTRLMLMDEFRRVELRATQSPEYLEGLIYALLYQPPPKGFRSAIKYGEEYLKLFGEDNWRVFRALACAYGQEYGHSRDHGASQESLGQVRNRAYSAVSRAIELNKDERSSLRRLWDPQFTTPQENDLEVFSEDDGFKHLFTSKLEDAERRANNEHVSLAKPSDPGKDKEGLPSS